MERRGWLVAVEGEVHWWRLVMRARHRHRVRLLSLLLLLLLLLRVSLLLIHLLLWREWLAGLRWLRAWRLTDVGLEPDLEHTSIELVAAVLLDPSRGVFLARK